jgi:hypothetical protein
MMGEQQRFSGLLADRRVPAAFVLQQAPRIEQTIEEAPTIAEEPAAASEGEKLGANVGSWMNGGQVK